MGILDRIAGTLDELRRGDGDTEARARDDIALARGFADRGDVDAAAERLDDVARRHPRLAAVHVASGELAARRRDPEAAAVAFGRAVDLDPVDAEAWLGLGTALASLARFEPARDALRRALTRPLPAERRARAQAGLGALYAGAGQLGKSIRELRKAADVLPDDAEVLASLGRALVAVGSADGPDWLARAARLPGGGAPLLIEAARARTNDDDAAERLLREAVVLAPDDSSAHAALAHHLVRVGRAAEALPEATAATELQPNQAAAWAALRAAHVALGAHTAAVADAHREEACGGALPFSDWLALAFASESRAAIEDAVAHGRAGDGGLDDARALLAGTLDDAGLARLAGFAATEPARRFVIRLRAPAPVPIGNLYALLGWAVELCVRRPALGSLAAPASRALEAFDRPLLVAVMGEFNAGKSSFVNALAGAWVAPVGVTPTTATVNVLRYGPAGGRVLFHDGTTRDLDAAGAIEFLRKLDAHEATLIRQVEVFAPLDKLRRVEIVDTPGLNSLRPEHEKVARDYLLEADAIVWVFAAGQAAKATEHEALALARAADKKVLGVVNKVDRASPAEATEIVRYVKAACGDLVGDVVPLAARAALDARLRGDDDALGASGLPAVEAALESSFFRRARALKRATALATLRRFVSQARALSAEPAGDPTSDGTADASDTHAEAAELAVVDAAESQLRSTIAAERVALRARLDEGIRSAAFEVRELVRPRSWLLGDHRADPADEGFLCDLLDDAALRATAATRAAIGAVIPTAPVLATHAASLTAAIDGAIERFRAYARGIFEGAAAVFFRIDLPRIRLDLAAIHNALARWSPDPEEPLFRELEREITGFARQARGDAALRARGRAIAALIEDEHVRRPLDAFAGEIEALAIAAPDEATR